MQSFEIRNKLRNVEPRICGEGQKTLIMGSVGSSIEHHSLEIEMRKAKAAQSVGADAVTDHSFYGDIASFHSELVKKLKILASTVGCYEFASRHRKDKFRNVGNDEAILILKEQAKRGIDLITVHASFKHDHLSLIHKSNRIIPTSSKGGGIVSSYMLSTGKENPYYQYFDDILDIFLKYNVTLSLGTSFRPATVCDDWDELIEAEVSTMKKLVARALDCGVKVMIEGLGHVSIDRIPHFIKKTKSLCFNVPYRVLPIATDIALGFDHISGAIAGAIAVASGADAITCMSRAEHIGLPNIKELKEAIISARIAAHCGELAKLQDFSLDKQMSISRWKKGCKGDWSVTIYPEGAKNALKSKGRLADQLLQCSMCGFNCGIASGIASSKNKIN